MKSKGLFREQLLPDSAVEWHDAWGDRFADPPLDPLDPAPPDLPAATDAGEPCPF